MMVIRSLADFNGSSLGGAVTADTATVTVQGLRLRLDTSKGWGLLVGHQRGLSPGHLWGLFHGHGQLRWLVAVP